MQRHGQRIDPRFEKDGALWTYQRVARLKVELLAQELCDGLEAVEGGDPKVVGLQAARSVRGIAEAIFGTYLHDGRIADCFEADNDCNSDTSQCPEPLRQSIGPTFGCIFLLVLLQRLKRSR